MTPKKLLIFGISVILGGALLFAIFGVPRLLDRHAEFKARLPTYLEKPQNLLPHKSAAPPDSIAVSGKLVVVNLNNKNLDPVFEKLPPELKPAVPEEVKTVLWVTCEESTTDWKYTDGTRGVINKCQLIFIDLPSRKYLWRDTVNTRIELWKKSGERFVPPAPTEEILQYLAQLPRRD